ncbi:MAG TPA: ATP-binding protein [Bdellovibrionales bacterium]|nr:ATP-binding protein [Bdellovibrionales bacterium]
MPHREGLSSLDFAHLKSAIDEAAIVAITDKKGVITYVNKKFTAISKYSAEELIGNTHKIINSGHHPKEFFVDMWKTIASGQVWEGEIRNRAKDGAHYWVHTTIVPFLDAEGRPEQYVAVRYEITERKMAEEQLKVYANRLEVSNRELQDFASVAAHDLQEPLRKIQSFSDRLRSKAHAKLAADESEYLDRIQNSANRMQVLINDLLTYSRVTTRAQPFKRVDLNETMANVVSDLVVRIEQTGGKVEFKDLPAVDADPTQMHQLFQNLINNGLKFHKPGVPPVVRVTAERLTQSPFGRGRPAVLISIEDNGIGFEEKYLDRIFTIFQRLHGRHEYEGTGIGLAVCRKIVDRHGGLLTARSTPGKGSSFLVTLPMGQ